MGYDGFSLYRVLSEGKDMDYMLLRFLPLFLANIYFFFIPIKKSMKDVVTPPAYAHEMICSDQNLACHW